MRLQDPDQVASVEELRALGSWPGRRERLLSSQQRGLKQVKKHLQSLRSLLGAEGVCPSLSPTFRSSRKRSAKSCSVPGFPLPHDIDSNPGYQVHEFPHQHSLPLAQALPSKSFFKNINPTQPVWFSG